MTRDGYRGYVRHRTPPPPARVVAGCAAFGLVVGLLFAGGGRDGWATAAGLVVAFYVVLSGRSGGQAPPWGTFTWAAWLLAMIAGERAYHDALVGGVVFAVLGLLCVAAAVLLYRLPGHGRVIR